MNSENESIRANPAASAERPVRKLNSNASLQRNGVSPAWPPHSKEVQRSSMQDTSPAAPSPPGKSTSHPSALPLVPRLQSPVSLSQKTLLDGPHSLETNSPGTPEQVDAEQLGSAAKIAWASIEAQQHTMAPAREEGTLSREMDFQHDGPAQPKYPASSRNAPRMEVAPLRPGAALSAIDQPLHDTPDAALVAGAATPDDPASAGALRKGDRLSEVGGLDGNVDQFLELELRLLLKWYSTCMQSLASAPLSIEDFVCGVFKRLIALLLQSTIILFEVDVLQALWLV